MGIIYYSGNDKVGKRGTGYRPGTVQKGKYDKENDKPTIELM